MSVTVTNVNDAPVLASIPDDSIPEMLLFQFDASATDIDGDTLTFSLIGAPDGASIGPVTGEFSWTPSETQGPGVYTFTVKVTDDGSPVLSDEQVVELTVEEVNRAPVLDAIADDTIDEMEAYTFDADATDPDLPANTLTFSLIGAPDGASIGPVTGEFSWTPSETQGPGVYTFTVKVTDDGSPVLSDEQVVELTVEEVNRAPVLDAIADDTIDEMEAYTTTPTRLTPTCRPTPSPSAWSVRRTAPRSARSRASSAGPRRDPGPGVYTFTVKVTDNGSPVLSDEQVVELTVEEVNRAPVLDAIGNKSVNEGSLLSFDADATDPDIPANGLTFSLANGANQLHVCDQLPGALECSHRSVDRRIHVDACRQRHLPDQGRGDRRWRPEPFRHERDHHHRIERQSDRSGSGRPVGRRRRERRASTLAASATQESTTLRGQSLLAGVTARPTRPSTRQRRARSARPATATATMARTPSL